MEILEFVSFFFKNDHDFQPIIDFRYHGDRNENH